MEDVYITCPICKQLLKQEQLSDHKLRIHESRPGIVLEPSITHNGITKQKKETINTPFIGKNFHLISKRATRIEKTGRCSRCNKIKSLLWCYSESSSGRIYLCTVCKEKVRGQLLHKSSRKPDAMDKAISSHFEGNRRRH